MISLISICIAGILFLLDQALKNRIESVPDSDLPYPLKDDKAEFMRVHNYGLAASKLKESPGVATGLSVFAFLLLIPLWIRTLFSKKRGGAKLAMAFMIGGGLSNIWDRLTRGYVVDFIRVKAGALKRYVFNCGDVFLLIGGILGILFMRKKK